jgi:hypothetical protein
MCTGQGVIPGNGKILRQFGVYAFIIMMEWRCLAMQDLASRADFATVNLINALPIELISLRSSTRMKRDLLSHTNSQNRNFPSEMFYGISANSRVRLRVTRTRADHQLGRPLRYKLFQCYLVISMNSHRGTFEDKILVNVPSK